MLQEERQKSNSLRHHAPVIPEGQGAAEAVESLQRPEQASTSGNWETKASRSDAQIRSDQSCNLLSEASCVSRHSEPDETPSELGRIAKRAKRNLNDSCCSAIVMNKVFENTTLFIIVLNAIWIWIDVEWNNPRLSVDGVPPLAPTSIAVENLFCTYFTLEVLLRFFAMDRKCMCILDGWFVFDSTLVALMVMETWLVPLIAVFSGGDDGDSGLSMFSSFRLLRLLRLTRMARLMRYLPELLTLVKGIIEALYSVSFVFLFLMLLTYVFALVFTSLIGVPGYEQPDDVEDTTAKTMFGDLGSAMLALFTHGVLWDNLWQALMAVKDEGYLLMMLFLSFTLISGMCLLNMLIGVLCQVMHATTMRETEKRREKETQDCLRRAFEQVDSTKDALVCRDEWTAMQSLPDARKSLAVLAQCTSGDLQEKLDKMGNSIFGTESTRDAPRRPASEDSLPVSNCKSKSTQVSRMDEGLNFEEFVEKILELRWETEASSLDVDVLRAHVVKSNKLTYKRLDNLQAMLEALLSDMGVQVPKDCQEQNNSQAEASWTPRKCSSATFASGSGAARERSNGDAPVTPRRISNNNAASNGNDGVVAFDDNSSLTALRQAPTELLFHALKSRPRFHEHMNLPGYIS